MLQSASGEEVEVAHDPRLSSSSPSIVRQAAEDGVGVTALPEWSCHELLAAGRLVRVLPEWQTRPTDVHAVYPARQNVPPRLTLFLDHLAKSLNPPPWAR